MSSKVSITLETVQVQVCCCLKCTKSPTYITFIQNVYDHLSAPHSCPVWILVCCFIKTERQRRSKLWKIRSAFYETRDSPFGALNRRRSEEFRRHGSLWSAPGRASGRQNVSVMFLLEETVWEERRSYDGLCGERIWLGRWPEVCGRAEGAFDLSVCSVCVCVCVQCVCAWMMVDLEKCTLGC